MRGYCFPSEVVSGESDQSIIEAAKGRGGSCTCCHSGTPTICPEYSGPTSKIPKALFEGAFSHWCSLFTQSPLWTAPGAGLWVGGGSVPWQTSSGMLPVLTVPCYAPAAAMTH